MPPPSLRNRADWSKTPHRAADDERQLIDQPFEMLVETLRLRSAALTPATTFTDSSTAPRLNTTSTRAVSPVASLIPDCRAKA
jgi:hypothetical protein